MIRDLGRESDALKKSVAELVVHLGGGIDYDQAWAISYEDRELLVRALNKKTREENPNAKEQM